MRIITLAILSLPFVPLAAQPTMGSGDAPSIGQQFTYYGGGTYTALPAGGAGQTWDFSGAGGTLGNSLNVVAAGSAVGAASFPTADVALAVTGFEEFIGITASGFEHHGQYLGSDNVVYSDKELYLQIPCTFGTTWTDDFAGSWNSGAYTFTGNISCTASGYGDLILPWGTVTNVLRIDVTQTRTENTGFSYTRTANYFYRPGTGYMVAFNDHLETFISGTLLSTNEEFTYLAQSSIGMTEVAAHGIGIDFMPVPASDQVSLVFGAEGALRLEVIDTKGGSVVDEALGVFAPGTHRRDLDITALPSGIYMVRITNGLGLQGCSRLVVE